MLTSVSAGKLMACHELIVVDIVVAFEHLSRGLRVLAHSAVFCNSAVPFVLRSKPSCRQWQGA